MKVVSMIDAVRQPDVIHKILRHCGLWKGTPKRGPPQLPEAEHPADPSELVYDETYFDRECC
ncbi:MAG: hypothetical protein GF331_00240 [Chitinivibrionales bacterium]|nr:hypothetical protein [Chitinivibrionales bacterium]